MRMIRWAEKKIRKLSICDFALVKAVLVLFGIIIGAYISAFIRQYVWYFVALFVILYAVLWYEVLKRK